MAGSRGMTDAQYAAADRKYRRRYLVATIGYVLVSLSQLAVYVFGDGSAWSLVAGVGFAIAAAGGFMVRRRGMPDTRPAPHK